MRSTLIRYRTLPERADDNQRAVEAVFTELQQKAPAGLRYVALRAPDATFFHLVLAEPLAAPMTDFDAFRTFREGLRARCAELPSPVDLTVVGDYRMVRT
jgi:hypothetical protein